MNWLWAQPGGRTTYTAQHVNIFAGMVRRHLTLPHRIACVTDTPEGIDRDIEIIPPPHEFEDVRIPTWGMLRPQCFRRLSMFRRDAAKIFGKRFVCMDLDCVISGNLDPLFDVKTDFKMFAGTARNRLYNGSMMLIEAGARPQVYEQFTPAGAVEAGKKYLGSDQAWISHVLGPGEATWGPMDGVHWYKSPDVGHRSQRRIMFFVGKVKPWELVVENEDPWVIEHYRAGKRGKCLMLGHNGGVWSDAAVALKRHGRGLPIIASPEASRYCDDVYAVAAEDVQADRLARMHGYESVWCGRSEADIRAFAA